MVERIKKARLIYNPTSGQEIIKKNIAEVLDVLEDVGYETSAYQTTPEPFSAQNEAERAAKAGFDLIIAAGGDGTINEVVNGVAGLENRPLQPARRAAAAAPAPPAFHLGLRLHRVRPASGLQRAALLGPNSAQRRIRRVLNLADTAVGVCVFQSRPAVSV